jgi:phytol kinase
MDRDTQGIVATLAYLFAVLIFSKGIMVLFPSLHLELIRKIIHILCTNWWFIQTYYFTTLWGALFGPTFFIIFNALGVAFDLWRFVGMSNRIRNFCLVYYPLSLFILVLLDQFNIIPRYCAGVGVFCMGYGDGFAALFGTAFGRKKLHRLAGSRTYVGTTVMFLVCVCVVYGFSVSYNVKWAATIPALGIIVTVAAAAALLEAFTPKGLDNLSVPIGAALLLACLDRLISSPL